MVNSIINALSAPLNFSVLASGRIKWFQIVTSIVYLSDLVILYFLFSIGMPPATAMWVKIGIMTAILFVRLFFAHREVPNIDLHSYLLQVFLPLVVMSVGSIAVGLALLSFFKNFFMRVALTAAVMVVNVTLVWFVALSKNQRESLVKIIKNRKK